MATFVLVSGAWHAAWCWERIVPVLQALGHRVIAPDLLGMGPDPTPLGEVSLSRWADQVADLVRGEAEPVILVGHSRGGIVISEAAERVPERIQRLVYLAAFMLRDGETMVGALQEGEERRGFLEFGPDDTLTVLATEVGPTLYNKTPPEWVRRAASLLSPEPMTVFSTPLELSDGRFGRVPRAYIECAEDWAVPLKLQRLFQTRLPCDVVTTLDTDHSPFYSAPEALAVALIEIAAR